MQDQQQKQSQGLYSSCREVTDRNTLQPRTATASLDEVLPVASKQCLAVRPFCILSCRTLSSLNYYLATLSDVYRVRHADLQSQHGQHDSMLMGSLLRTQGSIRCSIPVVQAPR